MNLDDSSGNTITLPADPDEYNVSSGIICQEIHWSVNSIYECQPKEQLIKYYHASLSSRSNYTLAAAAKVGYLIGFPGLDAKAINHHIGVEGDNEMNHLRQLPSETQ